LLGSVPAPALADHDLPAVAAGFRRIASWATAAELSAVAQIASRSAARDEKIGVLDDGRPARVSDAAMAEVALAETMSQFGASWWTDLAVTLTWRLPDTGAALSAGLIDLSRARLISEHTRVLSDDAARAVEQKVLPAAGNMTMGQLRAVLRRAVISVDPNGAEQRRKETERHARVMLYPDEEGTAGLAGQRLPGVHAAAAMARIQAIARAWKASGAGGGNDLLHAQVFIGLLCGTLPYIPPAEGAPPDEPPPTEPPPGEPPHEEPPPNEPRPGQPPGEPPGEPPHKEPPTEPPAGGSDAAPTWQAAPTEQWQDGPAPRDEDAPADDWYPAEDGQWPLLGDYHDERDWLLDSRPAPAWPDLPDVLPPGLGLPPTRRQEDGRPTGGLLDLTMPWQTLARLSAEPGVLGRIGPITSWQACQLAGHAARDPAAVWRVIVTNATGQSVAVARIPRPPDGGGGQDWSGQRTAPATSTGLVGRVTITICCDALPAAHGPPDVLRPDSRPDAMTAAALQAAIVAAARAAGLAAADAGAGPGGCGHAGGSQAYRPSPRLREEVVARDLTCRFPTCRQPAWRGDLDHTIPYDRGGRTCRCNLGGLCRTHHRIKQQAGWHLCQVRPGTFLWTTPAGRTYAATADIHPVVLLGEYIRPGLCSAG
jgi:hypothetical protein